jgi:hypothetical protein
MSAPAPESPTAPLSVRVLLIALLPVLALLIYLDGQRYVPDLVDFQTQDLETSPSASLFPEAIAGLVRMGQIRHFGKDDLYEYINGHAEYFIGAGFRGLGVGEFAVPGSQQPNLVVNLYDMGTPLNAFGVLVDEAGDQQSVEVGTLGFKSDRGLSFIHGPLYVQMSLFDNPTSPLETARFMAAILAETVDRADLAFRFPELGVTKSTRFVREYYRGVEFLNNVLERTFERNTTEIQVFMVSGTPRAIQTLMTSFTEFFAGEGIVQQPIRHNGLTFYKVEDPYEGEWFYLPLEEQLIGVYTPLDEGIAAEMQAYAEDLEQTTAP